MGASADPGSGIHLYNVTGAELINNTCINNYNGIYLYNSPSNSLSYNNCTNSTRDGIFIRNSNHNNVTFNWVSLSDGAGIRPHLSDYVRIGYNKVTNSDTGIIVAAANYNVIFNNNFSNNEEGMDAFGVNDNMLVSNNTFTDNSNLGIHMGDLNAGNFINNTFSGSSYIAFINYNVVNVIMSNNSFVGSSNGVWIESDTSVTFSWNTFANVGSFNVWDFDGDSIFDYNYYQGYSGLDDNDDGIGDSPYAFFDNSDPHPLIFPPDIPFWLDSPTDQTIELGDVFRYDLNATSQSPLTWWVNDTLNFIIMDDGVLYSLNPEIGTYGLKIEVSNIYGLSISAEITLHIIEYIPPSWTIIPEDQTISYGEPFDYLIHAIDNIGISRWTINDTVQFSIDSSEVFGGSVVQIINSTFLAPGDYGLNITAYDFHDNSISALFTITVEPPASDTTTTTTAETTTTTTTTTETIEGIDPLFTLSLGAGIGGISVLVVILIFLKRKP